MKKLRNNQLLLWAAAAVILVVVAIVLIVSVSGHRSRAQGEAIAQGIAYLEAQEAKDPAAIDELLRQRREAQLAQERDALVQRLTSGEQDVWAMFEDYVLLGDSRAVGFYYYDFLETKRVLAEGGDTIRKVAEHLDEIEALNPSYVFLCYGLNDVSIGFWPTPEEYAAEMIEVVHSINDRVPNATVVVSSILPATDPAFDLSSKWREIPQYSAAVHAACEENGIIFVDNDETAAAHMDLWQPDGIHLMPEFYPYWASNLIIAVLEDGNDENNDS